MEWAGGWPGEERPVGGRNLGTLVDKHLRLMGRGKAKEDISKPTEGREARWIFSLEDIPTISPYSSV